MKTVKKETLIIMVILPILILHLTDHQTALIHLTFCGTTLTIPTYFYNVYCTVFTDQVITLYAESGF